MEARRRPEEGREKEGWREKTETEVRRMGLDGLFEEMGVRGMKARKRM